MLAAGAALLWSAFSGPAGAQSSSPRIVAIGGAITEVVYALGMENLLIGVDLTSRFPEPARGLPQIGYMRALSVEGVLSLRPTVIIATTAAGPASTLEQLRATGIQTIVLPDRYDCESVALKIETVGKIVNREKQAQAMIARGTADMADLAARLKAVHDKPRVLFLLGAGGGGAPQASGAGTAADGMIRLAGGRNAVEGYEGYRPLTPEAAIAARPDFIIVTRQAAELAGGPGGILDPLPALKQTPAERTGKVLVFDAGLLLSFGPRTPAAARQLASAFHPGLLKE